MVVVRRGAASASPQLQQRPSSYPAVRFFCSSFLRSDPVCFVLVRLCRGWWWRRCLAVNGGLKRLQSPYLYTVHSSLCGSVTGLWCKVMVFRSVWIRWCEVVVDLWWCSGSVPICVDLSPIFCEVVVELRGGGFLVLLTSFPRFTIAF